MTAPNAREREIARNAIITWARALVSDVLRRHPGEKLHCSYMSGLKRAIDEYDAISSTHVRAALSHKDSPRG